MIECPIWKYNDSGTIPKYMLEDMAKNSKLSFAAIGVMVCMHYSQTPHAQGELDVRAGGSITKRIDELKSLRYIPTDKQMAIIENEEEQS